MEDLFRDFKSWSRWHKVREVEGSWRIDDTEKLEIEGLEGSIWGTPELRLEQFGSSEGPVPNIFFFKNFTDIENMSAVSFAVSVHLLPKKHGEQAGILLYGDDMNWVKLVVEGNKRGGTMIVLASQENGDPQVVGKVDDVENDGTQAFRLSLRVMGGRTVEAAVDDAPIATSSPCTIPNCAVGMKMMPAVMAHSFGPDTWASFRGQEVMWSSS